MFYILFNLHIVVDNISFVIITEIDNNIVIYLSGDNIIE